jgi:hypothetical protein
VDRVEFSVIGRISAIVARGAARRPPNVPETPGSSRGVMRSDAPAARHLS